MLSKENELLYAALKCGMRPLGSPIHRMQLFFIANFEFKSKAHVMTYQRTIETGVLTGIWDNHIKRGSGEYLITEKGHQIAINLFGEMFSPYRPAKAYEFELGLWGTIGDIDVEVKTRGKKSWGYLDGLEYRPTRACEMLQAETSVQINRPGFVALYNMGLDREFDMYFNQS